MKRRLGEKPDPKGCRKKGPHFLGNFGGGGGIEQRYYTFENPNVLNYVSKSYPQNYPHSDAAIHLAMRRIECVANRPRLGRVKGGRWSLQRAVDRLATANWPNSESVVC